MTKQKKNQKVSARQLCKSRRWKFSEFPNHISQYLTHVVKWSFAFLHGHKASNELCNLRVARDFRLSITFITIFFSAHSAIPDSINIVFHVWLVFSKDNKANCRRRRREVLSLGHASDLILWGSQWHTRNDQLICMNYFANPTLPSLWRSSVHARLLSFKHTNSFFS